MLQLITQYFVTLGKLLMPMAPMPSILASKLMSSAQTAFWAPNLHIQLLTWCILWCLDVMSHLTYLRWNSSYFCLSSPASLVTQSSLFLVSVNDIIIHLVILVRNIKFTPKTSFFQCSPYPNKYFSRVPIGFSDSPICAQIHIPIFFCLSQSHCLLVGLSAARESFLKADWSDDLLNLLVTFLYSEIKDHNTSQGL